MPHDALNRRLRYVGPQPGVRRLMLTDADYLLFQAIDRHGPLPTHYLHELTRHARSNLANLKFRLTHFYNGDAQGPYLTRPPQQFASFHARYQHLVYDLAPRAKVALAERGTLIRQKEGRAAPFVHQLMQACVGASFEIAARALDVRYISRGEILARACVQLALPLPGNRALIPDDLFGLEYPGSGYRFFAVEIDRNTESIERSISGQTSFGRKIAAYLQILRTRAFQTHWSIPNLTVLTVTTNRTHAANILDYIRVQDAGPFGERFLFQAEPSFGANWRVPSEVLSGVLADGWLTISGTRRIDIP
ncbi:replication-relaxation family protein [Sphingomonas sp.]|uniref:replication-relaxation family protein n=1 Tax=Sphingomonas sp. TaxID=28214 RepID=UPI003F6EE3A2